MFPYLTYLSSRMYWLTLSPSFLYVSACTSTRQGVSRHIIRERQKPQPRRSLHQPILRIGRQDSELPSQKTPQTRTRHDAAGPKPSRCTKTYPTKDEPGPSQVDLQWQIVINFQFLSSGRDVDGASGGCHSASGSCGGDLALLAASASKSILKEP